MGDPGRDQMSLIFSAIRKGESDAEHRLFELAYSELRRMAHARMFGEAPGITLQTTWLVNEVYLDACRGGQVHALQLDGRVPIDPIHFSVVRSLVELLGQQPEGRLQVPALACGERMLESR